MGSGIATQNQRLLRSDRLRTRAVVAKHAARVLIAEPEQFAEMPVYEFLGHIPYVSRTRISQWCAKVAVNPLRLGGDLSVGQRILFARLLADFARETA